MKKHINKQLVIEGVVLTMFDARTNLSIQVVDEVKKFFNSYAEDFLVKAEIIQRTEIIANKICISYSKEEIDNIRRTADDFTTMEENARQIMLIENYLAAWRLKAYQRLLLGKPFSIGVVLSYFFLERQEDSLIQAVLSAKSYNWDEGKIREALGL